MSLSQQIFAYHFSAFLNTEISPYKRFTSLIACQQPTFASKDFLLLLNEKNKLDQGCWSSYEKRPWNRVKNHIFTIGGWNSAGAITVNEMISSFLFILIFVQTSWAGRLTFINFSVACIMSCRFLCCCRYMRKAQVNFLICKKLHNPWTEFRFK